MEYQKRRHVRIATNLPATIRSEGIAEHQVELVDISEGGVGFSCDKEAAFDLLPPEHRVPGPLKTVYLSVDFKVPTSDQNINIRCRLAFCRRLSESQFHFGLQFLDITDQDAGYLKQYIRDVLFEQG